MTARELSKIERIREKIPQGVSVCMVGAADIRAAFSERMDDSNKADYGYIALVGGSKRYSGAIRLAAMANAAMRAGAGVVKIAVPESLCSLIAPDILESTLFPMPETNGMLACDESVLLELMRGVRVIAFGMGSGLSEDIGRILAFLLCHFQGRLLVDADGLNALSAMPQEIIARAECSMILTPHVKEFSRLCAASVEEIQEQPIKLAVQYAAKHGVTLLLKGASTIVTDGERVNIVNRGCPGMATAGSGDVLSGILAAVWGYNEDPMLAAMAAAYLNGAAGEAAQQVYGDISMIARDTIAALPEAIRQIRTEE